MKWSLWLNEIEVLTRNGQHVSARKLLKKISPKDIPREYSAAVGECAYRMNEFMFTLRILKPVLKPEHGESTATEKEKMIYATSLFSIGAVNEAGDLLKSLNPEANPEVHLYRAHACFSKWKYEESIPHLQSYLKTFSEENYRHTIGQVNLAAALIAVMKLTKADALLTKIEQTCETHGYRLLLGNTFELRGQYFIAQGLFEQATIALEKAKAFLKDQKGIYLFFAEKWLAIARLHLNPTNSAQAFANLRERATELKSWETLRELDLYQAIVEKKSELARKVVFGTRWKEYRERAIRLLRPHFPAENFSYSGKYLWSPEVLGCSAAVVDAHPVIMGLNGLPEQETLFAAYNLLTSDFYSPFNLGALFQEVYPNEYFDPYSTPERILRTLFRLKTWFRKNKLPLSVALKRGEFRIYAIAPVKLHLTHGAKPSRNIHSLEYVKKHFQHRAFSAGDVAAQLKLSRATSLKILKSGVDAGWLISSGATRARIYRFTGRPRNQKAKVAA